MTREEYLIRLVKSAITRTEAEVPSEPFDWTEFAAYAEEQQFEHILFPLFKDKCINNIDERVWHHLQQKYGKAVRCDMLQDIELDAISEAFSNNGISHIPLKGSVVKKYYPLPDLRRSSDFDILIHDFDREKANAVLTNMGYDCESYKQIMDDSYRKDKTHLELHVSLVSPQASSFEFLSKVWEYVEEENDFRYAMKSEFLYVYLLAHLHRHLMGGGGGIKLISDFWILQNSIELDPELIETFAKMANLSNLNHCTTELVNKWFGDKACNSEQALIIEQLILGSGAYGNYETAMKMKFSNQNSSRVMNFIKLAFPPTSYLKIRYPILENYPYLLPLMWIMRFLDFKGYNLKSIFKAAKDSEGSEILHDFVVYISQ